MPIALMTEDIQYGMKNLGIESSQYVYEECDAEGWDFLTETAVSLA
jgi:hypothetical protein